MFGSRLAHESRPADRPMPAPFQPSDLYQQRFDVSFEYPVLFQRDALAEADGHLEWAISRKEPARRHPVVFVVDSGVARAWPDLGDTVRRYVSARAGILELRSEPVLVPGGEQGKNDQAEVRRLVATLAQAKLDRQGVVVAIGGGAALDLVGYVASMIHRGLRLVRLPTTVLSQNDSGVGVKTGVNRFDAKNFLGTFAPPFAVINDSRWLETLPLREVRAGLAEAIKVALIRDAGFFGWLEEHASELRRAPVQNRRSLELEAAIRRCAELHLRHIASAGDPFELGAARPLDYGHWAAHRLEVLSEHELRHGEAVAIGMLLDARYAEREGRLDSESLERLITLVSRLGLPLFHPALLERDDDGTLSVLRGLRDFREHLGGQLCVTLLTGIGSSAEVHEMSAQRVSDAVEWLAAEADSRTRPA
jgi:3-dehydroquinate synthase